MATGLFGRSMGAGGIRGTSGGTFDPQAQFTAEADARRRQQEEEERRRREAAAQQAGRATATTQQAGLTPEEQRQRQEKAIRDAQTESATRQALQGVSPDRQPTTANVIAREEKVFSFPDGSTQVVDVQDQQAVADAIARGGSDSGADARFDPRSQRGQTFFSNLSKNKVTLPSGVSTFVEPGSPSEQQLLSQGGTITRTPEQAQVTLTMPDGRVMAVQGNQPQLIQQALANGAQVASPRQASLLAQGKDPNARDTNVFTPFVDAGKAVGGAVSNLFSSPDIPAVGAPVQTNTGLLGGGGGAQTSLAAGGAAAPPGAPPPPPSVDFPANTNLPSLPSLPDSGRGVTPEDVTGDRSGFVGAPPTTPLLPLPVPSPAAQGLTPTGAAGAGTAATLQDTTGFSPTGGVPGGLRTRQDELTDMLFARARGEGPSAADIQQQAGLEDALRQQIALSTAQSGVSAGAALRGANEAGIALQRQSIADAAARRAEEQATATGLLSQQLQGARGQDIEEAKLASSNALQQRALQLQELGLNQQDAINRLSLDLKERLGMAGLNVDLEKVRVVAAGVARGQDIEMALAQANVDSKMKGAWIQLIGSLGAKLL